MLDNIISFLDSNFFQTLAVGIGAFITWRVYHNNKMDKMRNAAALLILEVDSIVESAEKIKSIAVSEQVYHSTPVYQKLDWYTYRGILVSKLDTTHIQAINKFYENAIFLEEARQSFKNAVVTNRVSKIGSVQNDISKLLLEHVAILAPVQQPIGPPTFIHNTQDITNAINANVNNRLSTYESLYGIHFRDFVASGVIEYFNKAKNEFISLKNTPAYDELKKLAEGRRKF